MLGLQGCEGTHPLWPKITNRKPIEEVSKLNKLLRIGVVTLVGVLAIGAVAVSAVPVQAESMHGGGQGAALGQVAADPAGFARRGDNRNSGELSESEIEALGMALDDEYKAWSVYDQVIADFGAVRPFSSIQKAEEKHIAALVTLFDRYGLTVPANEWPGNVPSFDTLAEACEAGVQAEIENAALYDQLFTMVDNNDIIRVFTSLQQASLTKHLPAFERCAQ
jgi:hypothetical protein